MTDLFSTSIRLPTTRILIRGVLYFSAICSMAIALYGLQLSIRDSGNSEMISRLYPFREHTSWFTTSHVKVSNDEGLCEPYTRPGYLYVNKTHPDSTYFTTLDPNCTPSATKWMSQILSTNSSNTSIPELENKEILILGDSIDRNIVMDLCSQLGWETLSHPLTTYRKITENLNGGLPRTCTIPHLNLTIASWFFYGFDEENLFADKKKTYYPPGEYSQRWEIFTQAVTTLPSGGRPDLVFVNFGFWELARFDRKLEQAGFPDADPPIVTAEFLEEYRQKSKEFLHKLRELVGDEARIRWREMHTPAVSSGGYFTDGSGKLKLNRQRFASMKVQMINQAVKEIVKEYSAEEGERRGKEGIDTPNEDGSVHVWPIGSLVREFPATDIYKDDVHPRQGLGSNIWGEGVLEYLSRTSKKVKKD